MYEYRLKLADIKFHIRSERELDWNYSLINFRTEAEEPADIQAWFSWDWDALRAPQKEMPGPAEARRYYEDGRTRYFFRDGLRKRTLSGTVYDDGMHTFRCYFNEKPFLQVPTNLAGCLNSLPMMDIWAHYGALLLHAAQIAYRGKGILLTAPSGTGKTTQAKLWRDCRGAEILCNDRTIVRKTDGKWHTYASYADGTEPVRSGKIMELGALVFLRQAEQNRIKPLGIARGAACLMPQLALDPVSDRQHARARELLLDLLEDIPAFRLSCTPDERAVEMLENILAERNVIPDGKNI